MSIKELECGTKLKKKEARKIWNSDNIELFGIHNRLLT